MASGKVVDPLTSLSLNDVAYFLLFICESKEQILII